MNAQNRQDQQLANRASFKESRTARFNLPVQHPALWRFLRDQLLAPAIRMGRYRNLSTQILEDSLREMDRGHCK